MQNQSDRFAKESRAYPELSTLLPDYFPILHHVDRTLVDRVVCFVSEPVLITLMKRERHVAKMGSALVEQRQGKVHRSLAAHLFNGRHCDDKEQRQSTGDWTGGSVND